MAKGVAKRLWAGALSIVLVFSLLPLSSAFRLEPEGEAKMAAPGVFVLEGPNRKTLAPLLRSPAPWLALSVAWTAWESRRQILPLGRAPAHSPRPLLYSFGKLQLEGG